METIMKKLNNYLIILMLIFVTAFAVGCGRQNTAEAAEEAVSEAIVETVEEADTEQAPVEAKKKPVYTAVKASGANNADLVDQEMEFIYGYDIDEDMEADADLTAGAVSADVVPAEPVQEAVSAPEPAAPAAPVSAAGVIMVGDSRCVQMNEAVGGGGCTWICENGKRYEWFTETAIGRIDNLAGKGTKIVICMGVNDPGNASNYASMVNTKAAEWAAKGAKTYFVSVNPVWENPYTTEEQVETFNQTVSGSLSGVKWIDCHSYLVNNGYTIVDGLHYDSDTSVKIFNYIIGSL